MSDTFPIKDTSILHTKEKDIYFVLNNVFKNDTEKISSVLKINRITKAVFFITSRTSSKTLTKELEMAASKALSDTLSFIIDGSGERTLASLIQVHTLISAHGAQGLFTEGNTHLLLRAYEGIMKEVTSPKQTTSLELSRWIEEPMLPKQSDQEEVSGVHHGFERVGKVQGVSSKSSSPIRSSGVSVRNKVVPSAVSIVKDSRKGQIIDILKRTQQARIGDIAKSIKDVSEKTIQRELNALISEGRVKREGERRWSVYSVS